jgi:Bacterial regulatory protein, Fis family
VERRHIEQVLAESATLEEAAARLGVSVTTLWRKRKRYGRGQCSTARLASEVRHLPANRIDRIRSSASPTIPLLDMQP